MWNEFAKRKCFITGGPESTVAVQLMQNLSQILHMENARVILRRSYNKVSQQCEVPAAAAAC